MCGECQCQAGQYSGKYCDICPDCGPLDCGIYRDCVTCYHGNGGVSAELTYCNVGSVFYLIVGLFYHNRISLLLLVLFLVS